jgi:hypothetical protein
VTTQFETDLTAEVAKQIGVWNTAGNVDANRSFVSTGWYLDPSRFAAEASTVWTLWLNIARKNEPDLKPWLAPIVVAGGMEVMFARLVLLWQSLPVPTDGSLNPVVKAAMDKEIKTLVALVVK